MACLWMGLFASGVAAQERLQAADLARLTGLAYLDRDGFATSLRTHVPGAQISPDPLAARPGGDPFLWVIEGAFGPGGAAVPAGLIHCARYGLDTRDRMAGGALSDRAVFPLLSLTRAERDDAAQWPEDAVAVLRCSFSWDDARRLHPWSRAEALAVIGDRFAARREQDDAGIRAVAGAHIRDQYGPDGFRLSGQDGPRDSIAWWESVEIARQLSHQRVAFRVYLMGGGV